MATLIAETACVDPRAEIAEGVEIGPYCVVGPDVKIGRDTRLVAHVCLLGIVEMGESNVVSPFTVIGGEPQDVSYHGAPTRVEIGDHNVIREGVTINRATEKEDGVTRLGSHNFLMATAHVAHDCKLGDRITIANGTMLGGHVHVESHASISGGVAVHHYATIGGYSFVGGQSRIIHDVPRYMLVDGNPSKVRCINVVGLKRNGIGPEAIDALHEAHRLIYRAKMNAKHAMEILESHGHLLPEVQKLLDYVEAQQAGKHGRARERLEEVMNRLKVGVVGVGHLGRHHARVLAALPEVELVGVVDGRPEQARLVADACKTMPYGDYRNLLGLVDAVSVAVPTSAHREVAGAFLEAGIPTLVEKPLATTLLEAEELVAISEATGALLQVGHIERFNPALSSLDNLAFRPKYIAAERLGTYTFRSTDIGVVLDLMIHDIDLLLSMVPSPVKSVAAVGVAVFGKHEDVANARIEFEDGTVANLTASRASFQAVRKMRLYGPEGYVTLDFAAKTGTIVRPSDRLRRGEIDLYGLDLGQPSAVKERIFGKILRVDQVQGEGREPLALELEDFVHAIRSGTRPRVTGVDALRAVRVADQVLQSLRSHAWEGTTGGPTGPLDLPEPLAEPIANLPAPKFLRYGSRADSPSRKDG